MHSPVIGNSHKGETLYELSECLLLPCDYQWMALGDKNNQSKYQGQVKDRKPNGFGVIFDPQWKKVCGELEKWEMEWSRYLELIMMEGSLSAPREL